MFVKIFKNSDLIFDIIGHASFKLWPLMTTAKFNFSQHTNIKYKQRSFYIQKTFILNY